MASTHMEDMEIMAMSKISRSIEKVNESDAFEEHVKEDESGLQVSKIGLHAFNLFHL